MSVEEARGMVTDIAFGIGFTSDLDAALDRLILEVQAEMPCYAWQNTDCAGQSDLCPSCTARAKLKEPVSA